MDIQPISVLATLGVFALKLLGVLSGTCILNKIEKRSSNFVVAWALLYVYQAAIMLLLSYGSALRQAPLFLAWLLEIGALTAFSVVRCRDQFKKMVIDFCHNVNWWVVAIIGAGFIFLVVHSFIFFDSTGDAHAYGMPRIFIWSTSGSLFTNMHSLSKNIFVNEWIGEFNPIFYRVLTQDNISIPFGNVETYFFSVFGLYALAHEVMRKKVSADLTAVLFAFFPATVLLSLTCKGDFLGMISLPLMVFMLFSMWYESARQAKIIKLAGVIALGALGTGARITLIPGVGLLMILILMDILRQKDKKLIQTYLGASLVFYAVCWSRYALNLYYYGNPFERVDAANEQVRPSVSQLVHSLCDLLVDIAQGRFSLLPEETTWALTADLGVAGALFLLLLVFCGIWKLTQLAKQKSLPYEERRTFILIVILAFSILALCASTPYFAWSFRYFSPYVLALFIMILMFLDWNNRYISARIFSGLFAIVAAVNCLSSTSMMFMTGEVTGSTIKTALNSEEIMRRYQFHSWIIEQPYGQADIYDIYEPIRGNAKILVCQNTAQMISWVWGDNASNDVTLCTPDELSEYLENQSWDMLVLTDIIDLPASVLNELKQSERYIQQELPDLAFSVYTNVNVVSCYEGEFAAEDYNKTAYSVGLNPFDGAMCWLSENATVSVRADFSKGGTIQYSAGLDIVPFRKGDAPTVTIYMDGVEVWQQEVTYTGEYVATIPQGICEETGTHLFRFETNGAVYQNPANGQSLSIRLKSIEPNA